MKDLDFFCSALIGCLVGHFAPWCFVLATIISLLATVIVLLVMSRANEGFK